MTSLARRLLFLLPLGLATTVHAQVRASELASVAQTIDGTTITMEYYRPRLRGRTSVYGSGAVPWNTMWTPGANWATTLETTRDVTLDGRVVAKGKYSVWLIPRDSVAWTVILDHKSRLFHERPPDSSATQVRFTVLAQAGPEIETLTWSFPDVRSTGATLQFEWSNRRIPFEIRVTPSLVTTVPASDVQAYLGTYDATKQSLSPVRGALVVTHEQGTLRADFVPVHGYFRHFALVRTGPDIFAPGIYDKQGEIYEVLRPDLTFTFFHAPGEPVRVEARGVDDEIFWAGTKRR